MGKGLGHSFMTYFSLIVKYDTEFKNECFWMFMYVMAEKVPLFHIHVLFKVCHGISVLLQNQMFSDFGWSNFDIGKYLYWVCKSEPPMMRIMPLTYPHKCSLYTSLF